MFGWSYPDPDLTPDFIISFLPRFFRKGKELGKENERVSLGVSPRVSLGSFFLPDHEEDGGFENPLKKERK